MNKNISFDPDVKPEDVDSACVVSEVSWDTLKPHIKQAFRESKGEQLVGITITDFGIRAYFKTIKPKTDKSGMWNVSTTLI